MQASFFSSYKILQFFKKNKKKMAVFIKTRPK